VTGSSPPFTVFHPAAIVYAALLFPALSFAHLALCAAAIFFFADADIVRFTMDGPVAFAAPFAGADSPRTLIHLALCACAIFRREAADIIRFGWFVSRAFPTPFNDSITEIA
jgi:hypothetical protein